VFGIQGENRPSGVSGVSPSGEANYQEEAIGCSFNSSLNS
jgi:hypothetical protein